MKRPDITKILGECLIYNRFDNGIHYWASEVTFDFCKAHHKRVDFMEFKPQNQSAGGIDKGEFTCYEIKSCIEDFRSPNGHNFIGEKNYYVMPMEVWKDHCQEVQEKCGFFVGVMCPIYKEEFYEWQNPTEITEETRRWKMYIVKDAHPKPREHGLAELLFCMLRSGKCQNCKRT